MNDYGSPSGFVRRCFAVLAIVAFAAAVLALSELLMMIFAAVVIAVIVRAIARIFLRFGIPEGFAVTLAVFSLLSILTGLTWTFGGLVASQFAALLARIPEAIDATQQTFDGWGIDYDVRQAAADISEQMQGMTSQAGSFALSAGGVVTNILLILAGAIFFAAQPELYRQGLMRLVPKDREEVAETAFADSGRALGLWLQAQILSSIVVVILTYIGLVLVGVPSAAALAIIAGLLDFIPFIGPVIAGIPAVLIAFSVSPSTALWTVGVYVVIQQLQGNILQPLIQKRSVDLSPAVLLFAVVAAGSLFGLIGVILSAPLTVVGFVLIQRLYIEQVLGKEAKTPGPGGLGDEAPAKAASEEA
ncbi:AI-2E family transporter [Parasphingopyxis marina]|uniref:AI-2E family transporter n=1 Tax=Parasphingopyxis marina TaxID=2761622 RepID=A0A842I0C2_9SPHN|nr:AI-2E family transporter [Parasphingopyxis marina]MBC2778575.1 AI-2E family transporter [Parasphingopyxis marina]